MAIALVAVIALLVVAVTILSRHKQERTATPGSGKLLSQVKAIDGFSRVDIGNAFQVEISQAPHHSVSITADDNMMDLIQVEREGDNLRIGLAAGDYDNVSLRAKISMPELRGVLLSGASRCTMSGFSLVGDFSIGLSGASALEGSLETQIGDFRLSGASRIKVSGSAESLVIRGSGSSVFDLADFATSRAEVYLSGASRATLGVKVSVDVIELSGASTFSYTGNPEIKVVRTSGSSALERR